MKKDVAFFNPYPGTSSFRDTEVDRNLFFGREREADTLLGLVLSETPVVLFARAGIGKTSLIHAGLLEPLRKRGYFPIVARVTHDLARGPTQSVITRIEEYAREMKIVISGQGSSKSLWHYFMSRQFLKQGDPQKIVLILDQFEELFTTISEPLRASFIEQLSDLIRQRVPEAERVRAEEALAKLPEGVPAPKDLVDVAYGEAVPDIRVLLALREDYVPNLQALVQRVPTILRYTLRLEPFTVEHAREAIVKPTQSKVVPEQDRFEFEPRAIEEILAFLRTTEIGGHERTTETIEPFQLQILCHRLNEDRWRAGKTIIETEDLGGAKGMRKIIDDYYGEVRRKFRVMRLGWNSARFRPSATNFLLFHLPRLTIRRLCEIYLVTPNGFRNSVQEETIVQRYGVSLRELTRLVDLKLVRREPRLDSHFYEIVHDSLLPTLRAARQSRRPLAFAAIAAAGVAIFLAALGVGWLAIQGKDYAQLKLKMRAVNSELRLAQTASGKQRVELQEAIRNLVYLEQGLPLKSVTLRNLSLRGLPIRGSTDLSGATLDDVSFADVDLSNCETAKNKWLANEKRTVFGCASFDGSNHRATILTKAMLTGARFRGTTLKGADFTSAKLDSADFSHSPIHASFFNEADLLEAKFAHARLESVSMRRANLAGASFNSATLIDVQFDAADLYAADFSGATLDKTSTFEGTAWWLARGWSADEIGRLMKRFPPEEYARSAVYQEEIKYRMKRVAYAVDEDARADALNDLAWFRVTVGGDPKQAEIEAQHALKRRPQDGNLADTMAYILMRDNRFREAHKFSAMALGLDATGPMDLNGLTDKGAGKIYRYALCLQALGRTQDAKNVLALAQKLKKTYTPTHERVFMPGLTQAIQENNSN